MELPFKNEETFNLKVKGSRTQNSYEGNFTVKCILTNGDIGTVAQKFDAYNGGSATLAQGAAILNRAYAELEVRILKSPSWFKDSDFGRELFDSNVLLEIFAKAMDAEKNYGKQITTAADAAEEEVNKALAANKSKKEKKSE